MSLGSFHAGNRAEPRFVARPEHAGDSRCTACHDGARIGDFAENSLWSLHAAVPQEVATDGAVIACICTNVRRTRTKELRFSMRGVEDGD
jgi:hypothetical protein